MKISCDNSQRGVSKLLCWAHHTLFFQPSPWNVHGYQTKRQTPLRSGGSMWGTSAACASLHLSTAVIVILMMSCLFSACPAMCCCPSSFHLPVFTFPAGQGRWVTLPRAGCQCFPGHESLGAGSGSSHLHLACGSGASWPGQQSRSGSSSFPWCKAAPKCAAQWRWFVAFHLVETPIQYLVLL